MAKGVPKPSSLPRLAQLDGLRGLAILLVIATHLRLEPFFKAAPPVLQPFLSIFAHNGLVGVALLFMLSGYLMMTLYPEVASPTQFWQKRYTRIFPAFIAMATALALVRFFWDEVPKAVFIATTAAVILVVSGGWWLIRRSSYRAQLGKWLFIGFFVIQGLAAVGYIALQSLVPPAVFLQLWPTWLQSTIGWVVNTTMALPFGNYISQLDGVYWSVCLEVLFYVLYPIVILPLFTLVTKTRQPVIQLGALVATMGFFYALNLMAQNIFGLHLLQLRLGIFFILGMTLSSFEQSKYGQQLFHWMSSWPVLVAGGAAAAGALVSPLVWRSLTEVPHSWQLLYWSVPLSVMFFITLQNKNWWSNFLSRRWLTTLGTYSYSLYLTHTLAIELVNHSGNPKTVADASIALVASVALMTGLAVLVHFALEKPYLTSKIKPATKPATKPTKASDQLTKSFSKPWPNWLLAGSVTAVFLALVWQANRPLISPFAFAQPHILTAAPLQVITTEPVKLPFTANQNYLGMLLINVTPMTFEEAVRLASVTKGGVTEAAIRVRLLDSQQQQLHQSEFPIYQISESKFFTIGVPLQPESANANYTLELSSTDASASSYVGLVNDGVALRSVYFNDKKSVLSSPVNLLNLVWNKLVLPFTEPAAKLELALGLPLLIVVGLSVFYIPKFSKS